VTPPEPPGGPTRPEAERGPGTITGLLQAVAEGDSSARDQLFAQVYGEMRRLARRQLGAERIVSTLDTTALVHETYLKLSRGAPLSVRDRYHFFATVARHADGPD
jgi:DNA-directed RNA polymerase specialized sigma24 family protein